MRGWIRVSGRNNRRKPRKKSGKHRKKQKKTGHFRFQWYSIKFSCVLNASTFNELEDGKVMFKRIWTAEMIESHSYSTHSNKEPLNSHYYATHYPSVYAAAERIFGSWGEAYHGGAGAVKGTGM